MVSKYQGNTKWYHQWILVPPKYCFNCIRLLKVRHICSQENENQPHAPTLLHKRACAEVCSNPVSVLVYDPGVMSKPLAGYRLCAGVVRGGSADVEWYPMIGIAFLLHLALPVAAPSWTGLPVSLYRNQWPVCT